MNKDANSLSRRLGYVGKQGDGFRYFPSPMQMVL